MLFLSVLFGLHILFCHGLPWEKNVVENFKENVEGGEEEMIRKMYNIGGIKSLLMPGPFIEGNQVPKKYKLTQLSGTNCGTSSDAIIVNSINIPEEVVLGQNLTFSVNLTVREAIDRITVGKVTLQKIGLPYEIPCINGVGSCTYNNVCLLLKKTSRPCPPIVTKAGWNCKCPLPKMELVIPESTIFLPHSDIPSFLIDGSYTGKIQMFDGETELFCYKLSFSLKDP